MQVHPTRPNLNTSVLKWKRVSGKSVGQPTADADFASSNSGRSCRLACWMNSGVIYCISWRTTAVEKNTVWTIQGIST